MGRAEIALDTFHKLGVRLVLGGHHHRGYLHGHEPAADLHGSLLVAQASTATSTRLRGEPNAYHLIEVDRSGALAIAVRAWDGRQWREVTAREQGARLARPLRPKREPFVQPRVAELASRDNAPAGLG